MKKILIITAISGFLPQFEKNDVKILQEMGYQVHYASNFHNPVYSFDAKALKKQGIILHHIDIEKSPVHIRKNISALRQIKDIINTEQIKLIHCHNPMGGVVGRSAAAISKMHPYVIYTAHGFHFYKGAPIKNWLFYYTAERWFAHQTDLLITINKEDYNSAKKFHLKKGGAVEQIHGVGVDIDRFHEKTQVREAKRKEMGIPENAFHIVTAAELNKNKNQKVIIEAISKTGRNDIYYSICGKGDNADNLRQMIKEKRLESQIKLLGYRTDIEEILQTADCFAFPSIREGLGIAAIEALACGVPLIVSDNRGTREYAQNEINSIVCKAQDAEGFNQAIEKFYKDHRYHDMVAKCCRKTAEPFGTKETEKRMRLIYGMVDRRLNG